MGDPDPRPATPGAAPGHRYVLGADAHELERLRHQHEVWRHLAVEVFEELAVGPGWKVLDAGCGPGHVLAELRDRIGPQGECWGVDLTPEMLAAAARTATARGWSNVRLLQGDLCDLALPHDHFDLVWMRWVLSFPPDPAAILSRLASCLRPGGALAVQDYNHEGLGLFPESAGFSAVVRATRSLYRRGGGDPWVGARLPALFRRVGLELESYRANVLAGGPGEPAFEWADRFFPRFTERFVAEQLMSAQERRAFLEDWAARRADPDARYFSPILVTAVARRPAARA